MPESPPRSDDHQQQKHLTWKSALREAEQRLQNLMESPRLQAELLLMSLLGCSRAELFAHPERTLSSEQARLFAEWLERRSLDYPLQYLTGEQEFYGRRFEVSPEVLIPRPETEGLVETALNLLSRLRTPAHILDVGTGSGCIAVTLCCEHSKLTCLASDIHLPSLRVAQRNATFWDCLERIHLVCADGLGFLPEQQRFDLIVSNPPYITEEERRDLQSGVRDFEPGRALFAGREGLDLYRKLFQQAPTRLKPEGRLLCEIGAYREEAVRELARQTGWQTERVEKDLAGHPRVVVFQIA